MDRRSARGGCSYAGIELAEHRQTPLLDRLILDGVREFGYVAEGHGSLRNWVLVLRGIVQINHIIVGVIRHKLQCLGAVGSLTPTICTTRFRPEFLDF